MAKRPEICTLDSECLINKQDVFCLCRFPQKTTVVNGKEHKNDMVLCIKSAAQWRQFEVNSNDMGLLAQVCIEGMKQATTTFSIQYLFGQKMVHSCGLLYTENNEQNHRQALSMVSAERP